MSENGLCLQIIQIASWTGKMIEDMIYQRMQWGLDEHMDSEDIYGQRLETCFQPSNQGASKITILIWEKLQRTQKHFWQLYHINGNILMVLNIELYSPAGW